MSHDAYTNVHRRTQRVTKEVQVPRSTSQAYDTQSYIFYTVS
jgi:hypothetical protein